MRTTEKDILMICKGRYNHDKHENFEAALDAYYREHYLISKEDLPILSHKFLLTLWFNDCVKAFLKPETMNSFWFHVIHNESMAEKCFLNEDGCTEFYDVMYHRIVTWLTLLQVRDENGNWIIDLSDYEDVDFVI